MSQIRARARAIRQNATVRPSRDTWTNGEKGLDRFDDQPSGDRPTTAQRGSRAARTVRTVKHRNRLARSKIPISSLFSLSRSLETVPDGRRDGWG
jgi:hypothetical protein